MNFLHPPVPLACPTDHMPLAYTPEKGYSSPAGRHYPIVRGIPRFIDSEGYAEAFGAQWKRFQRTQLDSYTATNLSRTRFQRIAGGNLEQFRGKTVLEAGCGAGRFTEVLLQSGATVISTDLSSAVEANAKNFPDHPGHFVCQADLHSLPFRENQFDFVVCLGVLQHTPSPEAAMSKLITHLKPGGTLLIDHYGPNHHNIVSLRVIRSALLRFPPSFTLKFCEWLVRALWPLHRLSHRLRDKTALWRIPKIVERCSPVADYQRIYPTLGDSALLEWAILDTHDALTDHYKHTRTCDDLLAHLKSIPMDRAECWRGGNGVECRATKPATTIASRP